MNQLTSRAMLLLIFLGQVICTNAKGQMIYGHPKGLSGGLHCTDGLRFASTNEIVAFFQTNSLAFELVPLKQHSDHYFWVVSYPYSGLDTIDVYCFRRRSTKLNEWEVAVLYFILSPKHQDVKIVEASDHFSVRNGDSDLLSLKYAPEAEK
jgi:hypothetical protein